MNNMKNIHLLPTEKPSRLGRFIDTGKLSLRTDDDIPRGENINIYITSDEEIKEGDYFLYDETTVRYKTNGTEYHGGDLCHISGNRRYPVSKSKKIILTTDQDLIKDGVQSIDDEFLEWFIKNPSCEYVEVNIDYSKSVTNYSYKIIIPQEEPKTNLEKLPFPELVEELANYYREVPLVEEPKQETLEEAAENYVIDESYLPIYKEECERAFINGAKWQQKRSYSEEDIYHILCEHTAFLFAGGKSTLSAWFEQFKKK
jgi:hypothetical protein